MEMNSYWDQEGKYQKEYEAIWEQHVPATGHSAVVGGELVRAASRLTHDFYNNGMGNNTSGAINFLREFGSIDQGLYDTIYPYTRGRLYGGWYEADALHLAMIKMMDVTVEFILKNPQLLTIENAADMFDYSEETLDYCERCDCELDRFCSWQCEDCEEEYGD